MTFGIQEYPGRLKQRTPVDSDHPLSAIPVDECPLLLHLGRPIYRFLMKELTRRSAGVSGFHVEVKGLKKFQQNEDVTKNFLYILCCRHLILKTTIFKRYDYGQKLRKLLFLAVKGPKLLSLIERAFFRSTN